MARVVTTHVETLDPSSVVYGPRNLQVASDWLVASRLRLTKVREYLNGPMESSYKDIKLNMRNVVPVSVGFDGKFISMYPSIFSPVGMDGFLIFRDDIKRKGYFQRRTMRVLSSDGKDFQLLPVLHTYTITSE